MNNWLICRSCGCYNDWHPCDWVGVCPHSDENDHVFSVRCLSAYYDLKSGNAENVFTVVERNGISFNDYNKFVNIVDKFDNDKETKKTEISNERKS